MERWTLPLLFSLLWGVHIPLNAGDSWSVADYQGSGQWWGTGTSRSGGVIPRVEPAAPPPGNPLLSQPQQNPGAPSGRASGFGNNQGGGDRPNNLNPYPNRGGTTVYPWRYYRPVQPYLPAYPYPTPYPYAAPNYPYTPNYPNNPYYSPNNGYPPGWGYPQSPGGWNYRHWK